ncbi:MAG: hypothetical protein VZR02_04905 [Lachnospiraceae bacterium]|nr:hypothetical protein [Lachnospiraceae bacterium]
MTARPYAERRRAREKADSAKRIEKNRAKALNMSAGYVLFLAFAVAVTVFMSIQYLKLKETITNQTATNEKLASKLVTLQSENEAMKESLDSKIDWEYIRDTAINKLGMKYPTEDQIVWYNTEDSRYMQQYASVPSSKH